MTFIRYPHLERYGNLQVDGITYGVCYVFPKLDGTNASVWLSDKQEEFNYGIKSFRVCAGSRNRELNLDKDNAGFLAKIEKTISCIGGMGHKLYNYLLNNHTHVLYGEWLVPHTIKDYRDDAWRKFYVFDVFDRNTETFLSYDTYKPLLDHFGVDYVPCTRVIHNPSFENLQHEAKNSNFLMKEGCVGEGIVIKNYEWKNKHNHVTWAKIVNQEFKDDNAKVFGPSEIVNHTAAEIIAEKACTKTLIDKEYAKIVTEAGGWSSKLIPKLLHTVYYCVVTEELWDCLKLVQRGSVDFQELQAHCFRKTKILKPELF